MRRPLAASAAALLIAMSLAIPASAMQPVSDGASPPVDRRHGYALVQLNGEPLSTYAKTKPAPARRSTSTAPRPSRIAPSSPRCATTSRQWLKVNAPEGAGHRRLGHLASTPSRSSSTARRSRRCARRRMVKRAEYAGLYYKTADGPRPGADRRDRGVGPRVGGAANAGDGRQGRASSTPASTSRTLLRRRGLRRPDAARRPPLHEQQGHRRPRSSTTRPPTRAASTPRRSTTTARTWPARSPATSRRRPRSTAPTSRTTRPASRRRRCSATTTSSRARSTNARSEDILNALEAAYADGFDVANMSLGGGAQRRPGPADHGRRQPRRRQHGRRRRRRQRRRGPGPTSPSTSPRFPVGARALTAGASSVGHYVAAPVTVGGETYGAGLRRLPGRRGRAARQAPRRRHDGARSTRSPGSARPAPRCRPGR